jgi:hypothetical protein
VSWLAGNCIGRLTRLIWPGRLDEQNQDFNHIEMAQELLGSGAASRENAMKTLLSLSAILLATFIATGCGSDGIEGANGYNIDDEAELIEDGAIARVPVEAPQCGDDVLDISEECDDGLENDDFGACTHECRINVCGDGLVFEGVEECDDGEENGTEATVCTADCVLPA